MCRSSLGNNLQSVASALGIIRVYRQLLYRLQHSDEFPHECHGWQEGPATWRMGYRGCQPNCTTHISVTACHCQHINNSSCLSRQHQGEDNTHHKNSFTYQQQHCFTSPEIHHLGECNLTWLALVQLSCQHTRLFYNA